MSTNLVFWVVDHRWLPFTVHLIVPIFGFLRIWIWNVFWLLPIFGLRIFGIVDVLTVIPVFWLFRFRILLVDIYIFSYHLIFEYYVQYIKLYIKFNLVDPRCLISFLLHQLHSPFHFNVFYVPVLLSCFIIH